MNKDIIKDLQKLESYMKIMKKLAKGEDEEIWKYSLCISDMEYLFYRLKLDVEIELQK